MAVNKPQSSRKVKPPKTEDTADQNPANGIGQIAAIALKIIPKLPGYQKGILLIIAMSTIAALAAGFALIYREQYNLGASLVILAFILSGGALIVLDRLIRYDPDLRRDPLDPHVYPIVEPG